MASEAPRHPLRDVLAQSDAQQPLDWLTGVVVATQLSTPPYQVRVRLADGTETGWLSYLGWYAPVVDDVVHMLRKGPALLVLGSDAPANVYVPPAPVVPPAPPPPPPAAPTVRTVSLSPVDAAYISPWGWRTEALIQGGPNAYRSFWWYGTQIATAKSSGTITAGSIYVQRMSDEHGVGGAANVRLGTHAQTTRGGSGPAHSNVSVQATLRRGKDALVPLSAAQIASLNAGARGLGLEPGASSYSSPDYLKAVIGGASGQLSLTIED